MTNYCKSNVRRVINYTNHEPVNKYDLWLSENLRYNEYGELEYDNNGQPACDLILKIFRNGQWEPIVGYNTAAGNKINIVSGVTYAPTGRTGYGLNHLPLFRSPSDSPDELFDAGTLGQALVTYVTSSDWQTIIEEGGLGNAITYQLGNSININHAEDNVLGGIFAARYNGNYADSNISDNTFLTQCKYKYGVPSDYHLYVHAKDIMTAIHDYTYEHGDDPNLPNILPPNIGGNITVDPSVLYRSFYNSPTILKGWTDDQNTAQKPRFELAGARTPQNRGKLLMLKSADDPFWSNGTNEYDEASNANALNWVSPQDLFGEYSYELPLASVGALGGIRASAHVNFPVPHTVECKLGTNLSFAQNAQYKKQALHIDVKDVKEALDEWYAENDSTEWDLNLKASYGIVVRKETFTDDDNNQIVSYTHSLSNYGQFTQEGLYCRTKFYDQATPGVQNRDYSYNDTHGLEWVSAQTIIEDGLGISSGTGYLYYNGSVFVLDSGTGGGGGGTTYYPLGLSNYTSPGNYLVGVSSGGTGGATKFLNGQGGWTEPVGTTYSDFAGSTHGLVPASSASSQSKFLKGDGTWGIPSVEADFEIALNTSIEDDADFTLDDTLLTSNSASNPVNERLSEWNYYNIDGDNKTVQFTFVNTHVSGNAIYIRFNTGPQSVRINTDADIILSNFSDQLSRIQLEASSSYLITIQFGVIKFEKIINFSNNNNVENQSN